MVSRLEQLRTDYRTLLPAKQGLGHAGEVSIARLGALAKEWLRLCRVVEARETGQHFGYVDRISKTLIGVVNVLKSKCTF